MYHNKRRWGLSPVGSAEELADVLTGDSRPLCSGFYVREHGRYVFLNDSRSKGPPQLYAVVKRVEEEGGRYLKLETIVFSKCSREEALGYIREALSGEMDESSIVSEVRARVDQPGKHRRCRLCG